MTSHPVHADPVQGDPEQSRLGQTAEPVLTLRGLRLSYPGTRALDWSPEDAMVIESGRSHGLLGENGAGKSTLLSIISGLAAPAGGSMELLGRPYAPASIGEARSRSVEIVLQEPGLVPSLTVAENFLLGRGAVDSRAGVLIPGRALRAVEGALEQIASHVSPRAVAGSLSLEDRKLVELARAIHFRPSVLLVDEMSACLGHTRLRILFEALQAQRDAGVAVVYISHYLEEIARICDTVSVLKDGKLVRTVPAETDPATLTRLMVGRPTSVLYRDDHVAHHSDREVLAVSGLSRRGAFQDVSFTVGAGEILGVGGLVGCGSEQLARTLFGELLADAGSIRLHGERFAPRSERQAIRQGVAYVPPDRDREGVILRASVAQNIVLPTLRWRARAGVYSGRRDRMIARGLIAELGIRCRGEHDVPFNLSGGNRQKIVIAKWLVNPPQVLLLHNPTRGIDVAAKAEIYGLIQRLTRSGTAVVLVSDELAELRGMSDRILILRKGHMTHEAIRDERPTEDQLVSHMI